MKLHVKEYSIEGQNAFVRRCLAGWWWIGQKHNSWVYYWTGKEWSQHGPMQFASARGAAAEITKVGGPAMTQIKDA